MKAIVLTYNRNAIITDHMLSCYHEIWPDNPFTFRVPYQDKKRYIPYVKIEFIESSPEIKATVLTLLQDLDDEEWVYWCIDDKYPIQLKINNITNIYHSIINHKIEKIDGILFCRARRMLDPACVTLSSEMAGKERLLERNAYHQIWIHQFIKVKVLRYLFAYFPDVIQNAKDMDAYKDELVKPRTHRLFVTETNYSVFGESLVSGTITPNCLTSLSEKGFPMPRWQSADLVGNIIFGGVIGEGRGFCGVGALSGSRKGT